MLKTSVHHGLLWVIKKLNKNSFNNHRNIIEQTRIMAFFRHYNYQEVKSLPIDRERFRGVLEGAQTPPMVPLERDKNTFHFLVKHRNVIIRAFYLISV